MELIKISMLYLVPLLVFHTILDKKLIDLRLQEESYGDEVLAQLIQKARWSFLLKRFELVQIGAELLLVGLASASMLTNLIPDSIHVSDLIL